MSERSLTLSEGGHIPVIRSERVKRRELLRGAYELVKHRSPTGKGVRTIMDMLREHDIFDDFIAEHGGEEVTLSVLLARIADGEAPKYVADHYGLHFGFVWEFLTETPERLARLHAAQEGVAECDMGDIVGIADLATNEDVQVSALQIKARTTRAAAYNRKRFGNEKVLQSAPTVGMVIDAGLAFAASELLARIVRPAERVIEAEPAAEQVYI